MVRKNIKIIISSFLVLLIIGGCKVGPNYKQPKYDLGKTYRYSTASDSVSLADTSWTYIFTDPVLQALIRQGLSNNFDLKIAFARVNQAMASFKQAKSEMWPSINAEANGSYNARQLPAKSGGISEYNDLYAVGSLTWEIDIWGKLRRAKESAKAQLLSQEAYRQSVYI